MAVPKVFVSSTCYDLKEIRDSLYEFIESIGYIPVFSDKNDVFYHPDLHTHESCIKEIESCQLFILIIGGRFGGNYKYDQNKSIVNAEYDAAKRLNIPIFAFVQRDVYSNQFTYIKNQLSEIAEKIHYPAIADQAYSKNIFEFISFVRKGEENNGIFEFEFARDIKDILKKQFAGLFYDFLWDRKREKDSVRTKNILYDLSSISKKTEELLENIYRKVEDKNPNTLINKLDLEDRARKFWYIVLEKFGLQLKNTTKDRIIELSKVKKTDTWIKYFSNFDDKYDIVETNEIKFIRHKITNKQIAFEWPIDQNEIFEIESSEVELINDYFNSFKQLSEAKRIDVLNSFK